ncbi:MAG: hypothetical protein ACLPM3_02050 [Terracidiphilus sp.]
MSLGLTDSEMLERRCRAWEKTRQHGQFRYAIVRGLVFAGFLFLPDILIFGDDIRKTSWEVTAAVSFFFFLVGYWEAPKSWNRAERRYEADKQYLEVIGKQDSSIVS